MFKSHFYNRTIFKTVALFGSLFNNIEIIRTDSKGNEKARSKVPISYGPSKKYLKRIEQRKNVHGRKSALKLPRMTFVMGPLVRDTDRTLSKYNTVFSVDENGRKIGSEIMSAPWNINFTLSILVENQEDGLQIIEQIVPYFTPTYKVAVKDILGKGSITDIPITLEDVSPEIEYEGDFGNSRNAFVYSLEFKVGTYLTTGENTNVKPIYHVDVDVKEMDGKHLTNISVNAEEQSDGEFVISESFTINGDE